MIRNLCVVQRPSHAVDGHTKRGECWCRGMCVYGAFLVHVLRDPLVNTLGQVHDLALLQTPDVNGNVLNIRVGCVHLELVPRTRQAHKHVANLPAPTTQRRVVSPCNPYLSGSTREHSRTHLHLSGLYKVRQPDLGLGALDGSIDAIHELAWLGWADPHTTRSLSGAHARANTNSGQARDGARRRRQDGRVANHVRVWASVRQGAVQVMQKAFPAADNNNRHHIGCVYRGYSAVALGSAPRQWATTVSCLPMAEPCTVLNVVEGEA